MNTLIAIALGVWKKANCWVLQLERTTLYMGGRQFSKTKL